MKNNNDSLVSVLCMTYNQSAYITDALNGFVMQQTNFPFVAVIVDDASTDEEQKVIKNYLEKHFDHSEKTGYKEWETEDACWVFARHKENENCHFVAVFLKRNLYKEHKKKESIIKDWMDSKYIALCEGDDYWTDPLKLQKQVDFMERNNDYMLCFHSVKVLDQSGVLINDDLRDVPDVTSIYDLSKENYIHTPSVVYRKDYRIDCDQKSITGVFVLDYLLWLLCAKYGKLYKIQDSMAVYRKGVGVWTKSEFSNERRAMEWIVALSKVSSIIEDPIAENILDDHIKRYKESILNEIEKNKKEVLKVRQSYSYRVGRCFVHPNRVIKDLCARFR